MEERIIDDEYGRGIRLRKTADGYVDVTDETLAEGEQPEEADEIAFEFPDWEEDDEDLVGLSAEEAALVRKQKAEAAEQRRAAYEAACAEGEKLLAEADFAAAEQKYEEALQLDGIATAASVGYWRAKTKGFAEPDKLLEEYLETGAEGLEYDLGTEALQIVRKEHRADFERRVQELSAEEKPLAKTVGEAQARRREYLSVRRARAALAFVLSGLPFVVALAATIIVGLKNFSTPDNHFVTPTIVLGCATVALFVVFGVFINKLLNACRIYRANESLPSTEDGARLVELRAYKAVYAELLAPQAAATDEAPESEK